MKALSFTFLMVYGINPHRHPPPLTECVAQSCRKFFVSVCSHTQKQQTGFSVTTGNDKQLLSMAAALLIESRQRLTTALNDRESTERALLFRTHRKQADGTLAGPEPRRYLEKSNGMRNISNTGCSVSVFTLEQKNGDD